MTRRNEGPDLAAEQERTARIWGVLAILFSVPPLGLAIWMIAASELYSIGILVCAVAIGLPSLLWGASQVLRGSSADEE